LIIPVKQTDITDCGPACVQSILAHYQHHPKLHDIKLLNPLKIGFYNFHDLSLVLHQYGFEAAGYQVDPESLKEIRLPAIAHVTAPAWQTHFIVIDKVLDHALTIMDPAKGKLLLISLEEFKRRWTGRVLLIEPPKNSSVNNASSSVGRFQQFLLNKRSIIVTFLFFAIALAIGYFLVR
jgi:ATP-binding cassette, subfamily C, bacteriocin exporter